MSETSYRRTAEIALGLSGAVIATVLMGGFSLVITRTDEQSFAGTLYPLLRDTASLTGPGGTVAGAYEAARTLGAWFGITAMICLALAVTGTVLTRRQPARQVNGIWFLATGVVCLLGSQLLMYPVAFLFFLSAGLFAVRKPESGSHR